MFEAIIYIQLIILYIYTQGILSLLCHLLLELTMFSYSGEHCLVVNGQWIMLELEVMRCYIICNSIFKLAIALLPH